MQKLIIIFILFFFLFPAFAHTQKNVTTYLYAQYNKTIYDPTFGNNPWSVGLGLQTFFNNTTKFKLTIELTGDIYLENDKVLRINSNGTEMNDVRGMINLFCGTSFHPVQNMYVSFLAGPAFINGQTFLGVKPAIGFYFSNNHRWTGKLSYNNIFDRNKITKEDFGTVSLAIGIKLF